MWKILATLALFILTASAQAQVATVPASYTSIFAGNPPGTYTGIDCCGEDPTGKTPCGFTRDADTFVFMLSGQSLNGNNVNGALAPSAAVCHYNPYDGRLYADGVRLLGPLADAPAGACVNTDGSQCRDNIGRHIAAEILSGHTPNHYSKVILISVPIGGSQAAFWATGAYAPHMAGIISSVVSHGMTPTAVGWGEGESANQAGTSQVDQFNALTTLIANARAAGLPSTVPWIIALETKAIVGGVPAGSPAVRAAQLQIVNPANNIRSGPDYDVNIPYDSNCRLYPSPHLTGVGTCWPGVANGAAGWTGVLWVDKFHQAGLF